MDQKYDFKVAMEEIIYSIEGEGESMGIPTIFIRTSGCTVGCAYCDTKSSWTVKMDNIYDNDRLFEELTIAKNKTGIRRILITGGEPLEQSTDVSKMIDFIDFKFNGYFNIEIETSGVYNLDLIKTNQQIFFIADIKLKNAGSHARNKAKKGEPIFSSAVKPNNILIKFVVNNRKDWDEAKKIMFKHKDYFYAVSLAFGQNNKIKVRKDVISEIAHDMVYDSGFRGVNVRLLIQIHKIMGLY